MTTSLINLLLYTPFVLTVVITGLIFCIRGYRQGLYRALISLGITAVSTLLSILISCNVSEALSKRIAKLIPQDIFKDLEAIRELSVSLLTAFVQLFVALIMFGLLFLIFLIVFKAVLRNTKKHVLVPKNKGLKWGGVFIRFIDTIIVATILMLPIYGPVATYASPAKSIVAFLDGENSSAVKQLSDISENPILSIYRFEPIAWIETHLSYIKIGDVSVDLRKLAKASGNTVEKVAKVTTSENREEILESIADLTKTLREEVVEEEWFYDLMGEIKSVVAPVVDKLDNRDKAIAEKALDSLDLPPEKFASTGVALLDFITYSIESGAVDVLETKDMETLPEDFHEELQEFIDSDETSLGKSILITAVQDSFVDTKKQETLLEIADTAEEEAQIVEQMQAEGASRAEEVIDAYLNEGADKAEQLLNQYVHGGSQKAEDAINEYLNGDVDRADDLLDEYLNANSHDTQEILDQYLN